MDARNKSLQNELIETKHKSGFRILKEDNFFFFLFPFWFLLQLSWPKGHYMKVHFVLALYQIYLISIGNGQESWVVSSWYLVIITVLSIEHLVWATRWKVMLILELPVWLLPTTRFCNDLTALVNLRIISLVWWLPTLAQLTCARCLCMHKGIVQCPWCLPMRYQKHPHCSTD